MQQSTMGLTHTALATSCILGPNMHELYASLPVQRTLAPPEVQSLLRLIKQFVFDLNSIQVATQKSIGWPDWQIMKKLRNS